MTVTMIEGSVGRKRRGTVAWLAAALLAVIMAWAAPPARAGKVKPCELDKLATRYPELVGKTIKIGQDGVSVPFSYRDPKNPDHLIGSDADYARAVFACIGVPVEFVIGAWSSLLPAVPAGRVDTGRGDIVLASAALANAVAADKPDALKVGFTFLTDIKIGAGVTKGNTELEQAIMDGIVATQASGEIAKIFVSYKLDPELIIPPEILTK